MNKDLITEVKLLEAQKGVEIMFWLVRKMICSSEGNKPLHSWSVLHTVAQLLQFHSHPPQTICRHLSCA